MEPVPLNDVIRDYYYSRKEEFPDLSYEDFENICRTCMDFIKINLQKPSLPIIKVRFLGSFAVYEGRILKLAQRNEAYYKLGTRNEDRYRRVKAGLEDLLKRLAETGGRTIILTDDTEDEHITYEIKV